MVIVAGTRINTENIYTAFCLSNYLALSVFGQFKIQIHNCHCLHVGDVAKLPLSFFPGQELRLHLPSEKECYFKLPLSFSPGSWGFICLVRKSAISLFLFLLQCGLVSSQGGSSLWLWSNGAPADASKVEAIGWAGLREACSCAGAWTWTCMRVC